MKFPRRLTLRRSACGESFMGEGSAGWVHLHDLSEVGRRGSSDFVLPRVKELCTFSSS